MDDLSRYIRRERPKTNRLNSLQAALIWGVVGFLGWILVWVMLYKAIPQ